MSGGGSRRRIARIELDDRFPARRNPEAEHERAIAIYDLLEENSFAPTGHEGGPYHVTLGVAENRLVFDIRTEGGERVATLMLALTAFRKIVRDYFLVCSSYYDAIKTSSLQQIEAIDMGRRALHNEGAELLRQRLDGKVALDLDTARRLFTLVTVLQLPGEGRGA